MSALKTLAGAVASRVLPQCRFDQTIFVFGHMRCGSTALANILCSHPEVSGYGEAHVRYDSRTALGVLALNQWRRGAYRPVAGHLFDKILHNRYDDAPPPEFFGAKAIFLVRRPDESIQSIRHLFAKLGSGEYDSDESAAIYLEKRLSQLATTWQSFPQSHRIGLSFEQLTSDPDAALTAISELLRLKKPLENRYETTRKPIGLGAGDPLSSHKFKMIVASHKSTSLDVSTRQAAVPATLKTGLHDSYRRLLEMFTPQI